MEAENDDDINLCLSIDEGASLLNDTGYRKALCSLKLSDRHRDYHLMIKVKAEMDQFKEGLQSLGYLECLQSNPSLWEEYFLDASVPLTVYLTRQCSPILGCMCWGGCMTITFQCLHNLQNG